MAYVELSQTLAESFNALADEVQTLADRKTVLEHKLRFAHEQVRFFVLVWQLFKRLASSKPLLPNQSNKRCFRILRTSVHEQNDELS